MQYEVIWLVCHDVMLISFGYSKHIYKISLYRNKRYLLPLIGKNTMRFVVFFFLIYLYYFTLDMYKKVK